MMGEERVLVGPAHRISFADARRPPVLATSWLVVHLEYAARDAIALGLKEQKWSVGTSIEVEHLTPVPEGFVVTKGLHRRRVIDDVDRFARRVARKRGQS